MTITEKVAYLKGLSDGLGIDTEKSKEGKLISVIIDILEEMGMSIEDLEENATALGEELDAVSDDLADVEELLYGDDEDEDDECCCGDEDEDDFFEAECPNCKEKHFIFGKSKIEEISARHNIKTVCRLPIDPGFAAACDGGEIESLSSSGLDKMMKAIEKI